MDRAKTMNCVEPAGRAETNKSPPSTKEMRNGRAFLEKIPPPPHPIANPCALLEAQPCSALLRGDNNRRKRRSGGQRGPRGVA